MIKQSGSQIKGIAGSAIKQILQEPVEIAKTATEQVAGTETIGGQPSSAKASAGRQTAQHQKVTPSIEEQNKERILVAHRRELEEQIARQRRERTQKIEQVKVMEEEKEEEKEQKEKIEKESIFQKGLRLVTGRLKKRIETRLPKAA